MKHRLLRCRWLHSFSCEDLSGTWHPGSGLGDDDSHQESMPGPPVQRFMIWRWLIYRIHFSLGTENLELATFKGNIWSDGHDLEDGVVN